MVSKKVLTIVFIIAIIMFAFSIIMIFSNADANSASLSDDTVQPDVKQAQVSIIVNKPANTP